ncbi:hypothetical protein GCM10007385_31820 [Tateyamaria omphalii]|uniref:hypothetical protein n=1 Tax=Tateyamaria omphalii TaxID=299262 RepID=UPI00167B9529|nr:hypothetical protein [Tateyamaria omphalii]GGX60192.1 hypothetical protein GCM10007385_31820 [Tateyamaria omphalii]
MSDDGPASEIARAWKATVARTGEIVMWWDRIARPALTDAILADWTRTDVTLLTKEPLADHATS